MQGEEPLEPGFAGIHRAVPRVIENHKTEAISGEDAKIRDAGGVAEILKQRGKKYGSFVGHAEVTQSLKSIITYHLKIRGKTLRPTQQEALDMIFHKIGRIINGDPDYDDSWQDIAGYAQLEVDRIHGKIT